MYIYIYQVTTMLSTSVNVLKFNNKYSICHWLFQNTVHLQEKVTSNFSVYVFTIHEGLFIESWSGGDGYST